MTDDELTGSRMASPILGFTPGPWRVEMDGTSSGRWLAVLADDFEYDGGGSHELLRTETVQTNRGYPIGENWQDVDEAEAIYANARLIAAAPDLLAALQQIKNATHAYGRGGPWYDVERAEDVADAAIRKATGDD